MAADGRAVGPGRRVGGRYRLERMVGYGSTSTVWAARDDVLGRPVAVKHLPGVAGVVTGWHEARMAATVASPHVVRVYDFVIEEAQPFVVMELFPGRTLADLLVECGDATPRALARIAFDVLGALRAVHRAGLVHGDLTARNVLLDAAGRAVLTDFGLAAPIGRSDLVPRPRSRLDDTLPGPPHDPAEDVAALGALVRDALRGPRGGTGALAGLVRDMLAPDPAARPTAEEARQVLLVLLVDGAVGDDDHGTVAGSRRPLNDTGDAAGDEDGRADRPAARTGRS